MFGLSSQGLCLKITVLARQNNSKISAADVALLVAVHELKPPRIDCGLSSQNQPETRGWFCEDGDSEGEPLCMYRRVRAALTGAHAPVQQGLRVERASPQPSHHAATRVLGL